MSPSVGIVGGGVSGIASAKACLEYGLIPTVMEKSADFGGLWRPGTGYVWDSMTTNLSKYTCMLSDFPWTNETSELFPRNDQLHQYLKNYAQHFGITKHTIFNVTVIKVTMNKSRWKVLIRKNIDQQTEELEFDFIIIASGIFTTPNMGDFENIDKFQGDILHSGWYRNPTAFENKNVAVIGGAFSGTEISVDLSISGQTSSVYHIIRDVCWIVSRYHGEQKQPIDFVYFQRSLSKKHESLKQNHAKMNQVRNQMLHQMANRQNDFNVLRKNPNSEEVPLVTLSEHYFDEVHAERIKPKTGGLKGFTEKSIILGTGESIDIDSVILCTGYKCDITYLPNEILNKTSYDLNDTLQPLLLYKNTLVEGVIDMAFVGMYRGPHFAAIEMQARWAAMLFSGKLAYPTEEKLKDGIAEQLEIRNRRPRPQLPRMETVVFHDSLAEEIGVLPDFDKLKQDDPEFYEILWNGPVLPCSYRLCGPDAKPKIARKIIQEANGLYPKTQY